MTDRSSCRNLVLVLGDQLTPDLSSLKRADPARDRVLMVEVMEEATYVRHHKKKIAFLFSAMRHFAEGLRAAGWTVDYVTLDAEDNSGSFRGEVARAVRRCAPERLIVTEPGEWRVLEDMKGWSEALALPVDIVTDTRFFCDLAAFRAWASERKQLRMEFFYRDMRRKTGLLMQGDEPAGGKWNFDADNRKPAKPDLFLPKPKRFEPDRITREVLKLVADRFSGHIGDLEPFWFAVTQAQAEEAFEHFLEEALAGFGTYQDAMLSGQKFLFHSVVSTYLNAGLLDPMTLCRKVVAAYETGKAPLNAAEGFIRQILGWREYVRGIYWLKMPDYVTANALNATARLPGFYWTGQTRMRCLSEAITQTIEEAYAHHIQRLMVTGNFALLAGVDPAEVHDWYLAVYADAYEWVELPNTLGMSQFADGGLLGSKPYMSGGNYINRMSDYCGACDYDVRRRTGVGACPFNALYWDFLDRNADVLRGNPRLGQAYATWDRMSADNREACRDDATAFRNRLAAGEPV
ncbi:cryptochrome/photolyase family protein [Roseibium sediminicola]|uniref:Cryptochrome/photolyase family protein n=1 Tax=Roseibium sediminicola TaxID=2933272 RepID=A0ABT0GV34_9HYPH|nr:cryptochrome/photolyase family protein [Roseibium sp. CAU 1639]MCK7613291.1 cryptochrome/photolyase family protein [Roseibium sp. CAU 1639]